MLEYLDNILGSVTQLLDLGLPWEQMDTRFKDILGTRNENSAIELILENPAKKTWEQKYPLLLQVRFGDCEGQKESL